MGLGSGLGDRSHFGFHVDDTRGLGLGLGLGKERHTSSIVRSHFGLHVDVKRICGSSFSSSSLPVPLPHLVLHMRLV